MKNKEEETFWVTNISNMNVSLSDLALTINASSTVNLLDKRHYKYTKEQLIKSAKEGSLFKKRNKIFVRKLAPEVENKKKLFLSDNIIPTRKRSIFEITETKYEELNLSDEKYAEENAEIAEIDSKIIKG